MAECSLYGGLVPNSYVDKVFIEEAIVDTNNDGIIDLETPKISINIRLVDELSSNGTFALLEEALEVQLKQGEGQAAQRGAQEVNLKEYFKIWCILSNTQELTDKFETFFEEGNNSGNFKWTNSNIETGRYNSKTLNDAISTYNNSDGTVQIIIPYLFDLDTNEPVKHLTIFTYVQLDTESLEADFNLKMPESLKNPVGRFEEEIVIQNLVVNPELRIFLTEGGEIWNGAVHLHNGQYMEGATHTPEPHGFLEKTSAPINNVQDFRIRDEINVLIAEFDALTTLQNTFPGQQEVLNRTVSKNSYFSEISITKDENRDVRFLFAFDFGKYVIENSKYSSIISKMTPGIIPAVVLQSQIVQFKLNKKQVKKAPARNRINSPVQNFILSDETPTKPVILSLDDPHLNEINLILPNQTDPDDSIVRYFTGVDKETPKITITGVEFSNKKVSDGIYQYEIDIEILDGFVTVMNSIFKTVEIANSQYEKYVALTQIPNIYDPDARKFTPAGSLIMSSGSGDLEGIINVYLLVLSYFVDISTEPQSRFGGLSQFDFFKLRILNFVSPTVGTIDGILIFKDMLNSLLTQINNLMSVGHSSAGVEDTRQNQPSNNTSVFKQQTMRLTEDFDNTIDSRFINETYVDNISANKTRNFSGLTVYSFSELANASQTLFPEPVFFSGKSQQEMLDEQTKQENTLASKGINIVFQSEGEYVQSAKNMQTPKGNSTFLNQKAKSSTNYLGENSKGALENLNVNDVSPQDLFAETLNDKLRGTEQPLFWNASLLDGLPSEEEPLTPSQLRTQVEVLTGFVRPNMVSIPGYGSAVTKGYNFLLRDTLFETKQLLDLTVPVVETIPANSYYLCRQTRQGDIDVIDSFFLVKPEAKFQRRVTLEGAGIGSVLEAGRAGSGGMMAPTGGNRGSGAADTGGRGAGGNSMQVVTDENNEGSSGRGAGGNMMQVTTLADTLAKNLSKSGRDAIDTTSSSRTETKTSGEEEAGAEAVTMAQPVNQPRGQLAGLGDSTAAAPTLNNGGFGGGGGGYAG